MAPVWSKQRRSCLTFATIYGVGALCLLAVLAAIANLLSNQAIPNQCIEYRDSSAVVVIDVPVTPPPPPGHGPSADEDDMRFDPRILDGYQLWRVSPYNTPTPESLGIPDKDALPVLFVHGHRGAPSQAFAMATLANVRTASESHDASPRAFTFYTADFHEGSSAFHSGVLLAQAWFINDAARAILARHPRARHVAVFAHSMGGISARLAYHLANHPRGALDTLVTLNTPHQGHPYGVDAAVQRLFDGLHRRWSRPLVEAGWRPVHPGVVRDAEAARWPRVGGAGDLGVVAVTAREWWHLRPGEPPIPAPGAATIAAHAADPLRSVVLVSVTGGAMDNLVRPDLASLAGVVAPDRGFSASTQTMAGAWLQNVHEGIVNCGQAAAVLVDSLFELHAQILVRPEQQQWAAGQQSEEDVEADVRGRLESLRRHLRDSEASAAILLSQQPESPTQDVVAQGAAASGRGSRNASWFDFERGGGLHLHASSSSPSVVLLPSPDDAEGPQRLTTALWRGPWDREEHAWSGRTCIDLRLHAARGGQEQQQPVLSEERAGRGGVGGLQLMTDLPAGSFRVMLWRAPLPQQPVLYPSNASSADSRPLRLPCAKLRGPVSASSLAMALAAAASEGDTLGTGCVDVTAVLATIPDALRRNHLHNSWDRVRREPPAGTAEALAEIPARAAELAVTALGIAQTAWSGIVTFAASLPQLFIGHPDPKFQLPRHSASEPLLASPLLPRSLTWERHLHDHDPALAVDVRQRNVLRLLALPPDSLSGFEQICVAFDRPAPAPPRQPASPPPPPPPPQDMQSQSIHRPFVDQVLDTEGVEAKAGHVHFMMLQQTAAAPASASGPGGHPSPAPSTQTAVSGTQVQWNRPAGPDALVTVLHLDFLPSPYSAWSVTTEAQRCSGPSSVRAKPRRANWLPGDGDPEGRQQQDTPLFFPAVRYDSGGLAAALAAEERRREHPTANGTHAELPLDCVGCESLFLRPSLATRLNALPHLSGGVVPRLAEFALTTSALPPKLLRMEQRGGDAGGSSGGFDEELISASRNYHPTLVIFADPRCDYTVTLSSDGSTILGQWLHHHSPWAIAAMVATTLFILSAMLKEWEGRSRAAVAAVAAARRASVFGKSTSSAATRTFGTRNRSASTKLSSPASTPPPRVVDLFSFDAPPRLPHFPSLHHAIARSWRWLLVVSVVHAVIVPLVAPSWSPLDSLHGFAAAYAATTAVAVPVLSSGRWWPVQVGDISSSQGDHARQASAATPHVMALGTPLGWVAPTPADVALAFILAIASACAVSLLANAAIVACRCANRCRIVSYVVVRKWGAVSNARKGDGTPAQVREVCSSRDAPAVAGGASLRPMSSRSLRVGSQRLPTADSTRGEVLAFEDRLLGRGMPGWDAAEVEGTQSLRLVGASIDWENVPSTPTSSPVPSQAFLRRKVSTAVLSELAAGPTDGLCRDGGVSSSSGLGLPQSLHRSLSAGSAYTGTEVPSPRPSPRGFASNNIGGGLGTNGGVSAVPPMIPPQRRQPPSFSGLTAGLYAMLGDDRLRAAVASKRKTSAINEEDILRDIVDGVGETDVEVVIPRFQHRHTSSESSVTGSGPNRGAQMAHPTGCARTRSSDDADRDDAAARRFPPQLRHASSFSDRPCSSGHTQSGHTQLDKALSQVDRKDLSMPLQGAAVMPTLRGVTETANRNMSGLGATGVLLVPYASDDASNPAIGRGTVPTSVIARVAPPMIRVPDSAMRDRVQCTAQVSGEAAVLHGSSELASPSPTFLHGPEQSPSTTGEAGQLALQQCSTRIDAMGTDAVNSESVAVAIDGGSHDSDSQIGACSTAEEDGLSASSGVDKGAQHRLKQQRVLGAGASGSASVALVWWVATGDWVPGPPPPRPAPPPVGVIAKTLGHAASNSTIRSVEGEGRGSNDSGIELTPLAAASNARATAADTDESTDETGPASESGRAQSSTLTRGVGAPFGRAVPLTHPRGFPPPKDSGSAHQQRGRDNFTSVEGRIDSISEEAALAIGAAVPSGALRSQASPRGALMKMADSFWRMLFCVSEPRMWKGRRSHVPLVSVACTSVRRAGSGVARQVIRALAAAAAPLAATTTGGVTVICQALKSATPPLAQILPLLRWGAFLSVASFMPWLVLLGCYIVLLVQTLLSAASYHAARVRRRMFESQQLGAGPAGALCAGSCFSSALQALQQPQDSKVHLRDHTQEGQSKHADDGSDSNGNGRGSRRGGGGARPSDTRYYAHVVAIVNLLRYQQVLLLLYAAILGMQAMSIIHSLEAVPRLRHPFHRDLLWTLPMMLHLLAARSHTPATSPVLADALGLLRRVVLRIAVPASRLLPGCAAQPVSAALIRVGDALLQAQRTPLGRSCSPSVAIVAVAWSVFAASHHRLHALPALAGTLPAIIFFIGHARRWI